MKHTVYRSGDMILDLVTKVSYKKFLPYLKSFTIVALTATATAEVQQDIMSKLSIGQNDVVKTSTKRRNLIFKVNPTYQRQKFVVDYVANHEGQAGIIYCSTRKQVEELHEALNSEKLRAQFIMLV